MSEVILSLWNGGVNTSENLKKLTTGETVTRIVLYAHQEFNYVDTGHPTIDFQTLAEFSNTYNIPFQITTCRCANQPLSYDPVTYKNVEIYYWESYWFTDTRRVFEYIISQPPESTVYKYPFVSMNNRSHLHRCAMMDSLAEHNLINNSAVSWRDEYVTSQKINDTDPMLNYAGGTRSYPFKHWVPKRMFLTERDRNDPRTYSPHSLPVEYMESFMQLVVETTVNTIIFSEKTCVPLFVKKPFLVLAAPGHHAALVERGFVNYDEIFDYSFDSEPDLCRRADMIANNLLKIAVKTSAELHSIYNILLPKLQHNFERAMAIATDTNMIPYIIESK